MFIVYVANPEQQIKNFPLKTIYVLLAENIIFKSCLVTMVSL